MLAFYRNNIILAGAPAMSVGTRVGCWLVYLWFVKISWQHCISYPQSCYFGCRWDL